MYWTEGNSNGSIFLAGTGGHDPVQLMPSQNRPRGIVIDFEEWRLYWTCQGDDLIRSSNMDMGKNCVRSDLGQVLPLKELPCGAIEFTGLTTLDSSWKASAKTEREI